MKRFIGLTLASAMAITSMFSTFAISTAFADDDANLPSVVYNVDFSDYIANENWVTETGKLDKMPTGWSFDGLNRGNSSVAADNSIMVVDDPVSGGTHGKVLKIAPSQTDKNVILHKKFVDTAGKTVAGIKHQSGKKLHIKQSVYIKSTEASYFKNVDSDWYSAFLYVDSQSNSGGYQKGNGGSGAYLRLSSSTGFSSAATTIGTSGITNNVPVNKWFEVEFVLNTDNASVGTDNAISMTFDAYIDGVKVADGKSIGATKDQWNNLAEKFYGISFAPCAFISAASGKAPEMYIDNLYAAYICEDTGIVISDAKYSASDDNKISVTYTSNNGTGANVTATVIVAAYSLDNELIGVKTVQNNTFNAGVGDEQKNVESFSIEGTISEVRLFVWQDLDSMLPLIDFVTVTPAAQNAE